MVISVSISKKELKAIDDYCEQSGLSRSVFLIRSALIAIQEFDSGEINTKAIITESEKKEPDDKKWDFKPCKHGLNPALCKDPKCRNT